MSDPVTNVEIEDVLSSIRRLVSQDARSKRVEPSRTGGERLVLTPALRVAGGSEGPSDAAADETPAGTGVNGLDASDLSAQAPMLLTNPTEGDAAPDVEVAQPSAITANEPGLSIVTEEPAPASLEIDAILAQAAEDAVEGAVTPDVAEDAEDASVESFDGEGEATSTSDLLARLVEEEVARAFEEQSADAPELDNAEDAYTEEDPTDHRAPTAEAPDVPQEVEDELAQAVAEMAAQQPEDDEPWLEDQPETVLSPISADILADYADEPFDEDEIEEAVVVEGPVDDVADAPGDHAQVEDATPEAPKALFETARGPSLEQKIATLEELVSDPDDQWEADAPTDEAPAVFIRSSDSMEWEDVPEAPAPPAAPQAAPVVDTYDPLEPEPVEGPVVSHLVDIPEDADEGSFADEDTGADPVTELDEDMLRQVVTYIVRQELQGVLGERITRNVRKLVHREIRRAMLSDGS